ncbi:hypothetical protein N7532_002341 [Penicillium argentinense]|uniref:DNA-directed RNA polymerase III subunit RPC6 n=1 Tax=Penicillium argentinense TaxID=1131581 RepID=A0A9W9KL56_9EURO|nr:uncharacterized protein N7532_002341 [Penicillium argentinense]KAJ5109696.1 hypothetical protein N7532_002341 [Penicillium argentinense]
MAAAESRVAKLASKLYDACADNHDPDTLLYQHDLIDLGVLPSDDIALLLQCTQSLVDQKLFRLHQGQGRIGWKLIPREDAEKLQSLNADEALVYNVIHSTGRSGVWVRAIQQRTNLHKSILDRALKSLDNRNYIKSIHNVKYPSRRMYMLSGLVPYEDVSGGAWFTDGVLDANFINSLAGFIEYTVSRKSWYEVPATDRGRSAKRVKTATGKAEVNGEPPTKTYLPYPSNYKGYPTVKAITDAVNSSGITPVQLFEDRIMQLLDMLCFDKKLVALDNGQCYKSVKNPEAIKAAQSRKPPVEGVEPEPLLGRNGMTESPCGPCPNFKLCSPGAAISPETCEYFDPWIEQVLGF